VENVLTRLAHRIRDPGLLEGKFEM